MRGPTARTRYAFHSPFRTIVRYSFASRNTVCERLPSAAMWIFAPRSRDQAAAVLVVDAPQPEGAVVDVRLVAGGVAI